MPSTPQRSLLTELSEHLRTLYFRYSVTLPIYRMPVGEKLAVHSFVLATLSLLSFVVFYLPFVLVSHLVDLTGVLTIAQDGEGSTATATLFASGRGGGSVGRAGPASCDGAPMSHPPASASRRGLPSPIR
jgi:hypothetical protein